MILTSGITFPVNAWIVDRNLPTSLSSNARWRFWEMSPPEISDRSLTETITLCLHSLEDYTKTVLPLTQLESLNFTYCFTFKFFHLVPNQST